MQRIIRFLSTILQFLILTDNTYQSKFRQTKMAFKAVSNTIKTPKNILGQKQNLMKKFTTVLKKSSEKYASTRHSVGSSSIKYLRKEVTNNFKLPYGATSPSRFARAESKKNIQTKTFEMMGGRELKSFVNMFSVQNMAAFFATGGIGYSQLPAGAGNFNDMGQFPNNSLRHKQKSKEVVSYTKFGLDFIPDELMKLGVVKERLLEKAGEKKFDSEGEPVEVKPKPKAVKKKDLRSDVKINVGTETISGLCKKTHGNESENAAIKKQYKKKKTEFTGTGVFRCKDTGEILSTPRGMASYEPTRKKCEIETTGKPFEGFEKRQLMFNKEGSLSNQDGDYRFDTEVESTDPVDIRKEFLMSDTEISRRKYELKKIDELNKAALRRLDPKKTKVMYKKVDPEDDDTYDIDAKPDGMFSDKGGSGEKRVVREEYLMSEVESNRKYDEAYKKELKLRMLKTYDPAPTQFMPTEEEMPSGFSHENSVTTGVQTRPGEPEQFNDMFAEDRGMFSTDDVPVGMSDSSNERNQYSTTKDDPYTIVNNDPEASNQRYENSEPISFRSESRYEQGNSRPVRDNFKYRNQGNNRQFRDESNYEPQRNNELGGYMDESYVEQKSQISFSDDPKFNKQNNNEGFSHADSVKTGVSTSRSKPEQFNDMFTEERGMFSNEDVPVGMSESSMGERNQYSTTKDDPYTIVNNDPEAGNQPGEGSENPDVENDTSYE